MCHRDRVSQIFTPSHAPQTLFSPLTKKSGTKVHAGLLACLCSVCTVGVVSFGERDKSITLGKCGANDIWFYSSDVHKRSSICILYLVPTLCDCICYIRMAQPVRATAILLDMGILSYNILLRQDDNEKFFVASITIKKTITTMKNLDQNSTKKGAFCALLL